MRRKGKPMEQWIDGRTLISKDLIDEGAEDREKFLWVEESLLYEGQSVSNASYFFFLLKYVR